MPKTVVSCKGCGADNVWLKTMKGKNMPVDEETVEDDSEVYDKDVHTSHFDTCSNADQFRKKGGKR
jgi:hypothetical protein